MTSTTSSAERQRRYHAEHPDRRPEAQRRFRARHPDRMKEASKQYRARYPGRCAEAQRRWKDRNREKLNCASALQRKENLDLRREIEHRSYLKIRYGITIEQFNETLARQDGCCAICGTDDPGWGKWHVDHCHETGIVRGLLCHPCNTGMGMLRDSKSLLRKAIAYLEEYD